jgi:hypothetical protein
LHFRRTCSRHQQIFIEAAKRGGCYDPEKMDEVRRKTVAWLSAKFPRMVLDHDKLLPLRCERFLPGSSPIDTGGSAKFFSKHG